MMIRNCLLGFLLVLIMALASLAVLDIEQPILRAWISALGPFVGLLGLAAAALLNAYLSRVRDDRLRQQTSEQIMNAVCAEIGYIRHECGVLRRTLEATFDKGIHLSVNVEKVLKFSDTLVYHNNLDKLGVLSFEANAKLVKLYCMVSEYNKGISGYTDTEIKYLNENKNAYETFLKIAMDRLDTVTELANDALLTLDNERSAQAVPRNI
jgi:hypothetical protein